MNIDYVDDRPGWWMSYAIFSPVSFLRIMMRKLFEGTARLLRLESYEMHLRRLYRMTNRRYDCPRSSMLLKSSGAITCGR